VFSTGIDQIVRFADLLCTAGIEQGVIGPREQDRIWSRHLLSSAALGALVPVGAQVTDLGSGAGLPGIPLAIARPDLRVTLVEPMQRRVRFLEEAVRMLDLAVAIRRVRAEELALASCDVIVARAVAPMVELLTMTLPLLGPGGQLLAVKGERADAELAAAADLLRRHRHVRVSLDSCGVGEHTVRVVRVTVPPLVEVGEA
jgi:16S rRNA (guanine527-N7)-methyltransferase